MSSLLLSGVIVLLVVICLDVYIGVRLIKYNITPSVKMLLISGVLDIIMLYILAQLIVG